MAKRPLSDKNGSSFPCDRCNKRRDSEMSEASFERAWIKAQMKILEDLNPDQYAKLLVFLDDIPEQSKRNVKRSELPKVIIQHLGVKKSILVFRDALNDIPRMDPKVQDLLRPFVDRAENKQQKKKKREQGIHDSDSDESEEEPEPGPGKKQKRESVSDLSEESQSTTGHEMATGSDSTVESLDLEQTECPPEKEEKKPSWKISIHDVISSDQNKAKKPIAAKVVQKSGLRTYNTKDMKRKFFFHLAIADETGSFKVMVYGKQLYNKYEEDKSYLFKDVIVDMDQKVFKLIKQRTVSKTNSVIIPEDIRAQAQTLLYPSAPVRSIADIKASMETAPVSVEGVLKTIQVAEQVFVETQQRKTKRKDFCLRDGEDSVDVSLWGEHIQQFQGKREGDTVRVTNLKPKDYFGTITLNSTSYTRIVTVQSAPVQNVSIQIIGVIKAGKLKTHLDAQWNDEVQPLVVASKHLAAAFGISPEGNFEEKLLERIPLSAKAEIKGSKINAITAVTIEKNLPD